MRPIFTREAFLNKATMIQFRWHCNASMEHWRRDDYRVKPKSSLKNLNQGRFVHHKSHIKPAGIIMTMMLMIIIITITRHELGPS
jgi:hypothetical protein